MNQSRTITRVAGTLVAAALLLAVTGCGGGSSSSNNASSDQASTTTTASSSGGSNGSDLTGALDALNNGNLTDCAKVAAAFRRSPSTSSAATQGLSDSDIQKVQNEVDQLKGNVPSEIKADFQTWFDAVDQYAKDIGNIDPSKLLDPSYQKKLQDAAQGSRHPRGPEGPVEHRELPQRQVRRVGTAAPA